MQSDFLRVALQIEIQRRVDLEGAGLLRDARQRRFVISATSSRLTSAANIEAREICAGERPCAPLRALGAPSASLRPSASSSHVSSAFLLLNANSRTPDACASGSFAAPHGLAVDSRGDIYVSEVTWTFAVSRGLAPEGCHTFQKFSLTS